MLISTLPKHHNILDNAKKLLKDPGRFIEVYCSIILAIPNTSHWFFTRNLYYVNNRIVVIILSEQLNLASGYILLYYLLKIITTHNVIMTWNCIKNVKIEQNEKKLNHCMTSKCCQSLALTFHREYVRPKKVT